MVEMKSKMAQSKNPTMVRPKQKFHHGDLREALIAAARELVIEEGPDGFTLADACRRAGVTTAAPYKHFRDKQEILEEIASRGFDALAAKTAEAVAKAGSGTAAGVTAMGFSYVDFAISQPAVFRLMFGHNPKLKKAARVDDSGHDCFKGVIDEVAAFCRQHGLARDAESIAVQLWTFVHGAASLRIDGDYESVAPGLDVHQLIAEVTPRLLLGPAKASPRSERSNDRARSRK
jgi:AcrR family transcriptional regulator